MNRARGTFDVKLAPQLPEDKAEGVSLGRMSIEKRFHGDLEGVGKGQMLTALTAIEGLAGYVAVERVTGQLRGRSGSFVLQHNGLMTRGAPQLTVSVVPDSGTGELTGLTGSMTIKIEGGQHFYDLEYLLDAPPAQRNEATSSDGNPIRFEVTGEGEPTLVLVHGWALDRRLWDDQMKRLAARHRVVTLDLAAHGESGRQRAEWTMAAFGQDVKAVVDAVGAKQIVLVGHSMGGAVVLEAARRMPERVRGVVLVDIFLDVEERTSGEEIDAMARQLEADYKTTVTRFADEYLFVPATPAVVRERVLGHVTALPPHISIPLLRETWGYDPLPALREIEAPIRGVNADKFPTNLEVNRRHMPGYDAAIVEGTAHFLMLEDPTRFGRALDKALGQVLAAKP
jgi:pimeloyl-ACP methyl ester carboxylesterase